MTRQLQQTRIQQTVMMLFMLLVLICCTTGAAPKTKENDQWLTRENIALRFGAEWYKLGVLTREIDGINDVLGDIRDLELIPEQITAISDEEWVRFDKNIESLEKRQAALREKVSGFKSPLTDAIAILREMVTGEPVQSMFDVLEQGDLQRINQMLAVKHQIDTLWRGTDTLLNTLMSTLHVDIPVVRNDAFDNDFFLILRANLGLQSEHYYAKLNTIKELFIQKADSSGLSDMYKIETRRISQLIDGGNGLLAKRKMLDIMKRYHGKLNLNEAHVLLMRLQMSLNEYTAVLETSTAIPENSTIATQIAIYEFQSLYALKNYEEIWKKGQNLAIADIRGEYRNLLIWIIMESGLAIQKSANYTQLASLADRNAPFALHTMHALARSYIQQGDIGTAIPIFERALKIKAKTDIDKVAEQRIWVALAQSYYQMGNFDHALKLYFDLLKREESFEDALFGIVWCYISMGDFNKAELSLRKLINQMPSSPYAAEAILLLSREYVYKANKEWQKLTYLTKENSRLEKMLKKLREKQKADTLKLKRDDYEYAHDELTNLLSRIRTERRSSYSEISELFDKARRICNLIVGHYATGTFQEIKFTEKREEVLTILDSLMLAIKDKSAKSSQASILSNARQSRERIKTTVLNARTFEVETEVEQYRWEREYINWRKAQLSERAKEIKLARSQKTKVDGFDNVQLQHITNETDSLIAVEDDIRENQIPALIGKMAVLITTQLDSAQEGYFHYQVGELLYEQENASYTKAYEQYDLQKARYDDSLSRYNDGAQIPRPLQPEVPKLDHRASIEHYREALAHLPSNDFAAAAHYSLAWCYNDYSVHDSALTHMNIVADSFPHSTFAPQAWMYCGELLFDRGNLEKAVHCYQAVLKYPESEWFDDALYKLAWSQYRLSNPEKAISSFLALVDLGAKSGKGKALLEKESMDYIAISFSETDISGEKGLERAAAFVKKFGSVDRGSEILQQLARVYKEQGRYDMAKRTYRTLLKMFPDYHGSPSIEYEFLSVLERDMTPAQAVGLKMDFYRKYRSGSEWAHAQKIEQARASADSIACKVLYDAAIAYHQLALQKNDTTTYDIAMKTYEEFIRVYPNSPVANECHYNLAEIEFSIGNYEKAAEEYMAVSKRYPDSKYRETAAWNAIVASQNLLKQESR